jgi:8-oxo-dGTP pyrophosphatase MutT (NUDIX family)
VSSRPEPGVETSAGGVVFRCTADGPRYLLILDGYKAWGFPKGHVKAGESGSAAAQREIAEETGLADVNLHGPLGTIDWYFRFRGRLVHKYCHFYLFESQAGDATPQLEEGITACRWYAADEALTTISYDNARGILREAVARAPGLCASDGRGGRR